jgi:integrase
MAIAGHHADLSIRKTGHSQRKETKGEEKMSKRGGNRLKYQVEKSLNSINHIGHSKRGFRDQGTLTGIHSYKQMEHSLSVSQNFAEWAKDQGIRDLFQLKRAHYRDYIDHMRTKGVSNGHLINIETNLRLLQKGMDQVSREKGHEGRQWTPKTRLVDVSSREKPENRSYTANQLETAYTHLSKNAQIGADLQQAFGLRLREAANTKAAHIVEREGKLFWKASDDKTVLNSAQGLTKAGRGRETPCKPEFEARIRELIQHKGLQEKIVPVTYNTLKSAYNRAGLTGSHGFRHTYARDMLRAGLRAKGIEEEGRTMLQRMVENREAGYRKDNEVTREERPLYREVVRELDKVHGYLGHGEGRIDLAEVYMKGI